MTGVAIVCRDAETDRDDRDDRIRDSNWQKSIRSQAQQETHRLDL